MSQTAPYIVDQFATIVDRVNTKVLATIQANEMAITGKSESNIKVVRYQHGHPKEVIQTLKENDESQTLKFERLPLVALFEDFKVMDARVFGCWATVRLNLVILNHTKQEYVAEDRYAKNFKPILDVIYNELMIHIDKSGFYHIQDDTLIKHDMTRRLFWGRQGLYGGVANIFNDFIDAIEISNLELDVYFADTCSDS